MDDLTPYGDFQEALSNMCKVLNKCIEMNISLIPEKCEFLVNAGNILGHSISKEGIQVDLNNISIIKRVPTPQKKIYVRIFLGLFGYYRRFIKYFSKVDSPLFGLLAKDSVFCWKSNFQEALKVLKENFTIAPILRGHKWALPFHIHTDALDKFVGEALGQVEDKFPYDIYFISKNLSKD